MDPTPDDFERQVADLMGDRRLPDAMIAYARGMTDTYGGTPQAVSSLGDIGRFGIVAAIISAPVPVTQAAILDAMGPDLAGRARVAAHIALLQAAGALEPDDPDGRARPMRPGAWLERFMEGWLAAMILPARPWWPGAGPPPEPTRPLLAAYLGQVLAANRAGLNAFVSLPGVWRMMSLSCGHLFLLELILASDGGRTIGAPLDFSRRAFATRYGVSRAHAVDLIGEAEGLGWLERREGALLTTPAFAQEAARWCAIHFLLCNATLSGDLLPAMRRAAMVLPKG